MARGGWIYVGSRMKSFVPPAEKLQIMRTCEAFIADTIKPRAIPKKVPTDRNYPIDVVGKWLANRWPWSCGSPRFWRATGWALSKPANRSPSGPWRVNE